MKNLANISTRIKNEMQRGGHTYIYTCTFVGFSHVCTQVVKFCSEIRYFVPRDEVLYQVENYNIIKKRNYIISKLLSYVSDNVTEMIKTILNPSEFIYIARIVCVWTEYFFTLHESNLFTKVSSY
jgi:hypothetical protein